VSRIIKIVPWRRWYYIILVGGVIALIWALLHGGGGGGGNNTQPSQQYGFNDVTWRDPSVPAQEKKTELANAHAGYYRISLDWQYYEPTDGTVQAGFLPQQVGIYNEMIANGQTPVWLVFGTPYWAAKTGGTNHFQPAGYGCANNNNATTCINPPDVRDAHIDQAWQNFLKAAATAMPKAIYEIWNEPNLPFSWNIDQDPQLYGLMLKSATAAIHSVSPSTRVISGSLSAYEGQDSSAMTGETSFFQQMYPESGTAFDGIGFHAYPCNNNGPSHYTDALVHTIGVVRQQRDAAGATGKPLYLTEMGATTSNQTSEANCNTKFTEAQQNDALKASIEWAKTENANNHDLPLVLLHTLWDNVARAPAGTNPQSATVGSSENEFGLIAWTGSDTSHNFLKYEKPAFATVACEFAGNTNC